MQRFNNANRKKKLKIERRREILLLGCWLPALATRATTNASTTNIHVYDQVERWVKINAIPQQQWTENIHSQRRTAAAATAVVCGEDGVEYMRPMTTCDAPCLQFFLFFFVNFLLLFDVTVGCNCSSVWANQTMMQWSRRVQTERPNSNSDKTMSRPKPDCSNNFKVNNCGKKN